MSVATIKKEQEEITLSGFAHPGTILREEFLEPLGVSNYRLAKDIGLSESHVSELVRGKRDITAVTALKLSVYFGMSAEFWMNLQSHFNLEEAKVRIAAELKNIPVLPRPDLEPVPDFVLQADSKIDPSVNREANYLDKSPKGFD